MSSPDQNKANVKAFYDLAFNQRQPEEAVKRYVGSAYRQHHFPAGEWQDRRALGRVAGGSGKGGESEHDVLTEVVNHFLR